jgi:site-specific recombinase XerD
VTVGNDLVPATPWDLEPLDEAVADYVLSAISDNTKRAYQSDLRAFLNWGGSIPASDRMIARYLADHATKLAMSTLARRIVSIGKAHTMQGLVSPMNSPLVKLTMSGIRRKHGRPQRQVAAATKDIILAMVGGLGNDLRGQRDRALLLIGFAGAFRRSELVAIECADVRRVPEGVVITLRRGKTDQENKGREIGIPFANGAVCPVQAFENWAAASGCAGGPVFRPINRYGQISEKGLSSEAVALIVKDRALAAGLDPAEYSGHSLRAGLATSAASAGSQLWKIRSQTGHASDAMLHRYIRQVDLFTENVVSQIFNSPNADR